MIRASCFIKHICYHEEKIVFFHYTNAITWLGLHHVERHDVSQCNTYRIILNVEVD